MGRTRYRYNPETCKYEPHYLKGKPLRNRVMVFLMLSLLLGAAACLIYIKQVGSFDEVRFARQNVFLKTEWQILEDQINAAQRHLNELVDKDDHNYRVILDSSPLSANIREAGIGGSEKFDHKPFQNFPA